MVNELIMVNFICSAIIITIVYFGWTNSVEDEVFGDVEYVPGEWIKLNCFGRMLPNISFSSPLPFRNVTDIDVVTLVDCKPSIEYAAPLKKFNIEVSSIRKLAIKFKFTAMTATFFDAKLFKGLSIKLLTIQSLPDAPLARFKPDFLTSLQSLKSLTLYYIDLPPFPTDIHLEKIQLNDGKSLGEWGGCKHMRVLEISDWNVQLVPKHWLKNCSQLATLRLFRVDGISSIDRLNVIEGLTKLKELTIKETNLKTFPTELVNHAEKLKILIVSRQSFETVSLNNIKLKALASLKLSDNEITEIHGFPRFETKQLNISVKYNPIKIWWFNKSDYESLSSHHKVVNLESDQLSLDCDCHHGWFMKAVNGRHINLNVPIIECLDGNPLTNMSKDVLECDKFQCDDCICRRYWSDNTTVAHCNGKTSRVPRVRALRALHAAGNRIHTLSTRDLPDTLLLLDLRRNHISSMDTEVVSTLFSVKERHVLLTNNPIACHCSNKLLIEALQTYNRQIDDYNDLMCIEGQNKRLVRGVLASELCAEELRLQRQELLSILLSVSAVILGIASVAGAVYWRYRQYIKVYLYARGYCMWCLREDDVDCDRLYDAFLSFSHRDESFVLQELLPRLDAEYRLCLHFRDWVLGDFIPAQIARSVEQSRRTIIVLSRNFVESEWGMLEFRTAHTSALHEGRTRIIVIVLDDIVDDEDLAPELRNYIRTNTYVCWGDKWFWQKLYYAMPRRLQTSP